MKTAASILALLACAALWQLVEMCRDFRAHRMETGIERILAGVK